MGEAIRQALAVARKDVRAELRTRYALNATGMFVVVVVSVVAFAIGPEVLSPAIVAGLLWICFFFAAVTGLGRSLVAEQERGTMLLLRLSVPSTPVYFGKLLFNLGLALLSNGLIVALFLVLVPEGWGGSVGSLVVIGSVLSLGLAAALTIISGIISRASVRGALAPVLSFPILLPLIFLGVDMLRRAGEGKSLALMVDSLLLALAYTVVTVALSYILFDQLWKE